MTREEFEAVKSELTGLFNKIRPLEHRRKELCESLEGCRVYWRDPVEQVSYRGIVLGTMDYSGKVLVRLDGKYTPPICSVQALHLQLEEEVQK